MGNTNTEPSNSLVENVIAAVVSAVISIAGTSYVMLNGLLDSLYPDKDEVIEMKRQVEKQRRDNERFANTLKGHTLRIAATDSVIRKYNLYDPSANVFTIGSPALYSANALEYSTKVTELINTNNIDTEHLPSFRILAIQLEYLARVANLITLPSWYNHNTTLEEIHKSEATKSGEYLSKLDYERMMESIEEAQREYRTIFSSNPTFRDEALLSSIYLKLEIIALRYLSVRDESERQYLRSLLRSEIEGLGNEISEFNLHHHVLLRPFHSEFCIDFADSINCQKAW